MARTKIAQIPLAVPYAERYPEDGTDAHMINCIIERDSTGEIEVLRRPPLNYQGATAGTYLSYGTFYSEATNTIIGMHYNNGGAVWRAANMTGTPSDLDTTSLLAGAKDGMTYGLDIEYGGLGFAVVATSASGGTGLYNGTTVTLISDADYPGGEYGLAFVDGYLIAANSYRIYNSDLEDATAWTADNFVTPQFSQSIKRIMTHENNIVAFCSNSIEFFYNAGETSGSPFLQNRHATIGWLGVELNADDSSSATYIKTHNLVADIIPKSLAGFIGTNSSDATRGVYLLRKFNVEKVSTLEIDRYLNSASFDIDETFVSSLKYNNKNYLLIHTEYGATPNLYTFAYDIEEEVWMRWKANTNVHASGIPLVVGYAAAGTTSTFAQYGQLGDGDIVTIDPARTSDKDSGAASRAIEVEIVTPKFTGSEGEGWTDKSQKAIQVQGSEITGNTVSVSWTDDDYQTYNTPISTTLSKQYEDKIRQGGKFKSRAFKLTETSTSDLRLTQLELEYESRRR